jgi:hypothetical protein
MIDELRREALSFWQVLKSVKICEIHAKVAIAPRIGGDVFGQKIAIQKDFSWVVATADERVRAWLKSNGHVHSV